MKPTMNIEVGILNPAPVPQSQHKRRRMSVECADPSLRPSHEVELCLPTVRCSDYYTKPCLSELAIREFMNPGYCSSVQDFVVGRVGYGCVRFFGETDIRCLNVDHIVKFNRSEVVIYEDEDSKPVLGEGLNKPAEVTLVLHIKLVSNLTEGRLREIEEKLKRKTEKQGAKFISFDPSRSEWKFSVQHFSRFGLGEDDEEDIAMDDISLEPQDHADMNGSEVSDIDEDMSSVNQTPLSHSLPSHLGLDPARMKDLRLLLLSAEEDDLEDANGMLSHATAPFTKELSRSPLHHSSQKVVHKTHATPIRKTPLALLEYNPRSFTSNSPGGILMAQQNKSLHMNTSKSEGFQLEVKQKTPVTGCHSCNIVDAGLFMGRSFRVGWGPNGVLVHSGRSVGRADSRSALSSVISLEKVAMDKVTRDDSNKSSEELTKLCFDTTLNLHKNLDHEIKQVEQATFELKLQKLVCDRLTLPDICRSYINIIEKQLDVPTLSSASRVLLMHQVLVWELIKVLFSSRKMGRQLKFVEADDEDMIPDGIDGYPDPDQEALPLMRRAEFSYWLQECVYHHVQDEVDSLDESNDLEHMFLLLTGRQLDDAVELAASRGDVRLSSLLSQAGGSTANRRDIARQLDQWRKNGMDFNFIEKDRVRLLELLSGNIREALHCLKIDWKRYLGLLMWYQLPPDTSLPDIFNTYQKLLNDGTAPDPVPVYIDEGLIEANGDWVTNTRFDLAYYLMLLHAREEKDFGALKTMFSAFASTNDPLDYHMIWHHRSVLEAIGTFSSNDLHILDMAFVSQLLCLGQCHWAIYVVLHMPHREDYPYLQTTVIREILFQYCEVWSTQDSQWKFIEDLGVPLEWLNEALAVYFCYIGDMSKALHHFLECSNWQKAHSIFLTKVAHSLFLSAKHSEIWRLAMSMEDNKSEIEDWDLGAGIYISFYLLRSSLQEDSNTITELETLENKNDACADFIGRVNKSLAAWGTKLSLDARVVYSKMVEEISKVVVSDCGEGLFGEVQLGCFSTVFKGPVPEDIRSHHLQDAVSLFTGFLSQI